MVGELHRWLRHIGHDGRSCMQCNLPVEVFSMARRLCLDERARIEAMARAGLGAARIARCLGRHRSTVQRELARAGGPQGYRAGFAQQAAGARARRPRAPKLARDRVLAAAVAERLAQRWSPHAISADLGVRGLGVCAETVYRACYDHTGRSGLKPGSWNKLPRQRRRRKPRGRCGAGQTLGAGRVPAPSRPPGASRRQSRARLMGGRSHHRTRQPHRGRHTGRKSQPPHPGGAATRRLRRPKHRPGDHRGAGPPARPHGPHFDLGPRPRDGPLGRHRKNPGHRGVLLRAPIPLAATCQRAHQRPAPPMAPQINRPQHRTSPPRPHRRQPQHHAQKTPQLELSPNRLR